MGSGRAVLDAHQPPLPRPQGDPKSCPGTTTPECLPLRMAQGQHGGARERAEPGQVRPGSAGLLSSSGAASVSPGASPGSGTASWVGPGLSLGAAPTMNSATTIGENCSAPGREGAGELLGTQGSRPAQELSCCGADGLHPSLRSDSAGRNLKGPSEETERRSREQQRLPQSPPSSVLPSLPAPLLPRGPSNHLFHADGGSQSEAAIAAGKATAMATASAAAP